MKGILKTFTISVRSLVEEMLASGDIVSSMSGSIKANERALRGTRLHQKLQKAEDMGYEKEVPMERTHVLRREDVLGRKDVLHKEDGEAFAFLKVEGRADGIFTLDPGRVFQEKERRENREEPVEDDFEKLPEKCRVIDEIKSVEMPLKYIDTNTYPLHFYQAMCYAHYLAEDESLEKIAVRLSYIHVESEEVMYLYRLYTAQELDAWYKDLVARYAAFLRWKVEWDETRNTSLSQMAFPFESYRQGQRTMAAYVYHTIEDEKKVFLQAPTGIGKTMSALFPSLKQMGEEKAEKLFYLTAKNVTQEAVLRAEEILAGEGVKLKTVRITAKDRICFLEKRACNPKDCPYAKGHYDRINEAVLSSLKVKDLFDSDDIQEIARIHQVCPYELSLDLASWCDLIVCDYNYAFDPTASLRRFFQTGKKQEFVLLVDEAHNLADRARGMFSAEIHKKDILAFKKTLPKDSVLARSLSKVNQLFLSAKKEMGEQKVALAGASDEGLGGGGLSIGDEWIRALDRLADRMGEYFEICRKMELEVTEEALELYFDLLFFLKMEEEKDSGYETYMETMGSDMMLRLYCVDPSGALRKAYEKVKAIVFFSATMMPIRYYKTLLGAESEEEAIALKSPFDPSRRKILYSAVPVTYKTRGASVDECARLLRETISAKAGHYLAYFPSFVYLNMVYERFTELYPEVETLCQEQGMEEPEREAFVERFRSDEGPLLGFAVLGGVFAEGIDLKGDALIGVMIVSVGLPQLSAERDLIKRHFDRTQEDGFDFAYVYPGIGRVFQAAGRLIRSEEDAGVILLIDARFGQSRYERLYPPDWEVEGPVRAENLPEVLGEFWETVENS